MGLKWNGEITAGNVIAAAVVAIPFIGGSYLALDQIDRVQRTMNAQMIEFKDLKKDVSDIKLDLARKTWVIDQVQGHEVRIRALELRK